MPAISNTFDGKLITDLEYSRMPNNSWVFAMNAVAKNRAKTNFGLGPELSAKIVESVEDTVGTLYLDHINSTLILTKAQEFKLFNHDTEELKTVFTAQEFGCDFKLGNCEYHDITYQVNRETFIYFSSQDVYYWFNLDEMLSPERKEGLKKSLKCEGCIKGCDIFKVFLPTCGIKINAARQENGSGATEVGSYMFFARYINKNGMWTNWSLPSNKVNLTSEHNIPGDVSKDSAVIKLSGLDCKFNKIQIAYVKFVAGGVSAYILDPIGYRGEKMSFEFTGQQSEALTISDLLLSDQTNLYGRYLTVQNNRMFYYGIKSQKNFNIQKIANGIQTSVAVYTVPYSVVKQYDLKSLWGGETYALSIWLNKEDGTRTYAGHIPPQGASTSGTTTDINSGDSGISVDATPRKVTSTRSPNSNDLEDRASGCEEDVEDRASGCEEDVEGSDESTIKEWETEITAICDSLRPGCEGLTGDMFNEDGSINCNCGDAVDIYCESEEKKRQAEDCMKDILKLDTLLNNMGDRLADYGLDKVPSDYSASSIKEAAEKIIETVKNRERFIKEKAKYTVSYPAPEYLQNKFADFVQNIGDYTTASDGIKDFNVNTFMSAQLSIVPKEERDIYYPCITDCQGNFVYGNLAGTKVKHHTIPDRSVVPHFYSTSHGVLGKYNVEDPTEDLYVNLLGLKLDNINIPSEEELGFKLCPNNPYTIGIVPLTQSNRTVEAKGIAFGTFLISNGGKTYEQQRYGANSLEEVSRYHNGTGDFIRLSNQGSGQTHTVYSLDHLALGYNPSASILKKELDLTATGERFGLWAKGKEPADSIKGSRVDLRGTRQHIYFSKSSSALTAGDIEFIETAQANKVVSSDNHDRPLNNLSQQKCLWIKTSALTQKTDSSFTGDVLNHNVFIPDGKGDYVTFFNKRENQYGLLENLNYEPVLSGKGTSVQGLVGDCYIGLWSFTKTGYVSDQVGSATNKFNIPAQVPIKRERRCICDSPEDFVHDDLGQYVWTDLPEESDATDAKNWAGTHTIVDSRTQPYNEAVGNRAISGYYIPKTVTTLITVPIESRVCPWLLITGDRIEEQVPTDLKSDYVIDPGYSFDQDTKDWTKGYLTQNGWEHTQPSTWRKVVKALMRTVLVAWMPLWFLTDVTDIQGATDLAATLAKYPLVFQIWKQLKDQLFTNRIIDKLLGIPICKTDDVGGESDSFLRRLFKDYLRANIDFMDNYSFFTVEGIPNNFSDCNTRDHNLIYYSDEQDSFSHYDSLKHVRPGNRIEVPVEFGILTNLFSLRGNFYAHTTDHILPIRYGNVMVPTTIGQLKLGTGDLIQAADSIAGNVKEGYAGLAHKWLAKNTVIGYTFIDIDAGRIYLFSDGLQEISAGNSVFFKEHTRFCTDSDCYYERLNGVPHYDFAYDWLLDRLLVTKIDGKESTWTFSYYPEKQGWVSYHSYHPQIYLSDRKRTFRIENNILYKMNELGSCRKCYGDNKCNPFIVEYVTNVQPFTVDSTSTSDNATFKNMRFNLESYQNKGGRTLVRDIDSFFNKIAYYNQTQGSGILTVDLIKDDKRGMESAYNIIKQEPGRTKVFKRNRFYTLDSILDRVKDDCIQEPLVLQGECDYTWRINQDAFSDTPKLKQDFTGRKVDDKYLVVRLIKDDEGTVDYNLIDVKTVVENG